jgi:DNA topoisomerase VI subunit B
MSPAAYRRAGCCYAGFRFLQDLKAGINVFRYANRIPLLFEGGSDVITRTATKRINWCGRVKQNLRGSSRA